MSQIKKMEIRTSYARMDMDLIHDSLSSQTYWATGISRESVDVSWQNSFCIGVFDGDCQIAFARLVTDYATFAYLSDVFVVLEHRKKGVSKFMLEHLLSLSWVKNLRLIMLTTLDAQTLYQQFGFSPLRNPECSLEINRGSSYQ